MRDTAESATKPQAVKPAEATGRDFLNNETKI
jgi:hypothetical protein